MSRWRKLTPSEGLRNRLIWRAMITVWHWLRVPCSNDHSQIVGSHGLRRVIIMVIEGSIFPHKNIHGHTQTEIRLTRYTTLVYKFIWILANYSRKGKTICQTTVNHRLPELNWNIMGWHLWENKKHPNMMLRLTWNVSSKIDFFCQNILDWMYYNIRTQPAYTTRVVKINKIWWMKIVWKFGCCYDNRRNQWYERPS